MQPSGQSLLARLTLAAVLGVLFVASMNVNQFGAFSYVLASIFGMLFLGYVHYALWGYAFSLDVAEERAAFLKQQQRELDMQSPVDPYGIQARRHLPTPPDDRIKS